MSAESESSSNVMAEAMNGDGATPLVSVIVPVYGVERYLDACVEGLVGQTYRNLEILLVDDGSPDRCPAMCDAWTARDERIRVMRAMSDWRRPLATISTSSILMTWSSAISLNVRWRRCATMTPIW